MDSVDSESIRRHLDALLASDALGKSESCRRLLAYLAERALRGEAPKEIEIAIDVFGKDASFNGAEDSLVRVAARTLRQKLLEYYAGPGRNDAIHFVIPKGGYRLIAVPRPDSAPVAPGPRPDVAQPGAGRWITIGALALLAASILLNVHLWQSGRAPPEPGSAQVVASRVWADIYASDRPLILVLGDAFMFTQRDPVTGREVTVRDTRINSSEELRAFLASNPSLAAERGQRYVSYFTKSTVVGMASILRILDRPDRQIEVRVHDELRAEDLSNNDIIYIGPFVRLGPLVGHYVHQSRYRYDTEERSITDLVTKASYLPAGELRDHRKDYGLIAKFQGPNGNHIMIFTAVARNAGLQQIVRTLTAPESLAAFEELLSTKLGRSAPSSFEALVAVTGFRSTDLGAEVVDVNALAPSQSALHATLAPASAVQ